MYYKLTLEKLDPEMNTLQKTQVMVTEEMVKDASLEFDVLKLTAGNLVDRFRHDFEKEKQNSNLTAREYNSPIIQELVDETTPEEMEATNRQMLQEQMLQELVDALDNQHDLDPEFGKIIFENYDDLI